MAQLANVNRSKRSRRAVPKDYLPQWDGKQEQPWQEQLAIVKQLNAAFGGTRQGG